jgi:hypothetical protein
LPSLIAFTVSTRASFNILNCCSGESRARVSFTLTWSKRERDALSESGRATQQLFGDYYYLVPPSNCRLALASTSLCGQGAVLPVSCNWLKFHDAPAIWMHTPPSPSSCPLFLFFSLLRCAASAISPLSSWASVQPHTLKMRVRGER